MDDIKKFEEMAIKSYESLEMGDYRTSNRCGATIRKISAKLYKNGEMEKLKPLMYNEHDAVKFEAATELLPFYTEEAEAVLESLAPKKGASLYHAAEMTLKEWRKGNIKFEYYQK